MDPQSKPVSHVGPYALAFVFITVLIDMAGFAIIMPVLPTLIQELTDLPLNRASLWGSALMFVFAVTQFICAPLLGNLSDRFGRRPVLLLSLAGFGVNYALMGLAPSIAWLMLGRVVAGMFGATYSTANAFIADVSPPEKRAANFGLIGAAFGLGFIFGPVIGGLLADFGPRTPFLAAAALSGLNVVFGFFVLPETLPITRRRKFEWKRANPFGAFQHIRTRPVVMWLAFVVLIFGIGHQVYPSVWAYYTELKFHWTATQVGYSLGAVGIVHALTQALITRRAIPFLGEAKVAIIGIVVMALAFLGYGLVWQGWQIFLVIVLGFAQAMVNPAVIGIMSNRTLETEQGELQGAVASISSLGAVLGPFMFGGLFSVFAAKDAPVYFPGAPFMLAALLSVVALLVLIFAIGKMHQDPHIAEFDGEAG